MPVKRPTRALALSVPLALVMTGSLVSGAHAATPTLVWNTDLQTGANSDRALDSGWWHGPYAGNELTGASVGQEVVDQGVVGEAGSDPELLNGSLRMTRTDAQLSRIEYPTHKSLDAFVGTDPAATPRFSAYNAQADETTIGLGVGVVCNASTTKDWSGTLTLLATPGASWQEHVWPTAGSTDNVLYHSTTQASTSMAAFAQTCPDAAVVYATVTGGRDAAAEHYVDKVSFDGKAFDFAAATPVTGLAPDGKATFGDTVLHMQLDGTLMLTKAGAEVWKVETGAAGAHLTVGADGNVFIYDGDKPAWQTNTHGTTDTASVELVDGHFRVVREGATEFDNGIGVMGQGYPLSGDFVISSLAPGTSATHPDGTTRLSMQRDGNLVIYVDDKPTFHTRTFEPGSRLAVQSDGNVVIYDATGRWIWHTGTFGNRGATVVVEDGQLVVRSATGQTLFDSRSNTGVRNHLTVRSMRAGTAVNSADGLYRMSMQSDGNLVIRRGTAVLWHSRTYGNPGARLAVQSDGNVVIYSTTDKPLWHTGTFRNPGTRLLLLNGSGRLVLYSSTNQVLWATPQLGVVLNGN